VGQEAGIRDPQECVDGNLDAVAEVGESDYPFSAIMIARPGNGQGILDPRSSIATELTKLVAMPESGA